MWHIFDIDGPLMRGMTDIMHLFELNVLTLILSIPVVTAGAAVTAMHFCLIQIHEGKEGKVFSTYWKQFKGNLRSVTPLWLVLLVPGILLFLDYRMVLVTKILPRGFLVPLIVGVFLLAAVSVFAIPLSAKFYFPVRAALHNSVILAVAQFPRTIAMIAIYFVCIFLFTQVSSLLPLFVAVGISLPSYLCVFLYWPVLKKMIPGEADPGENTSEENTLEANTLEANTSKVNTPEEEASGFSSDEGKGEHDGQSGHEK